MLKFISLFILFTSLNLNAKVITIGHSLECPYICDKSSPNPGLIREILTHYFKGQGETVKFLKVPKKRVIKSLKEKNVQIALLLKNEILNFPNIISLGRPLALLGMGIISRDIDLSDIYSINDLNKYKYIVLGDAPDTIEKQSKTFPTLHGINGYKRLIKLVSLGRAQIGLGDFLTLDYLLKQSKKYQNYQRKMTSIAGFQYLHLSSLKNNKFNIKAFNQFQAKFRQSQEFEKLFKKYFDSDFSQFFPL